MDRKKYTSEKLMCVLCGPNTNQEKCTLFNFPKCPEQKAKWMTILNLKSINMRSRVCQMHFSKDQFIRVLLKKGAIPTLSVIHKHDENSSLPLKSANLVNILPKQRSVGKLNLFVSYRSSVSPQT